MLPSRYGALDFVVRKPYVCPSCTFRQQQRRKYVRERQELEQDIESDADAIGQNHHSLRETNSTASDVAKQASIDSEDKFFAERRRKIQEYNQRLAFQKQKINGRQDKYPVQQSQNVSQGEGPTFEQYYKRPGGVFINDTVRKIVNKPNAFRKYNYAESLPGDNTVRKLKGPARLFSLHLQDEKQRASRGACPIFSSPSKTVAMDSSLNVEDSSPRITYQWADSSSALFQDDTTKCKGHRKGPIAFSSEQSGVVASLNEANHDYVSSAEKHLQLVAQADSKREEHMKLLAARRNAEDKISTSPTRAPLGPRRKKLSRPNLSQVAAIISQRSRHMASSTLFSSSSGRNVMGQVDSLSFVQNRGLTLAQCRLLHTHFVKRAEAAAAVEPPIEEPLNPSTAHISRLNHMGIRAQLRQWQEVKGNGDPTPDVEQHDDISYEDEPMNNITRLPEQLSPVRSTQEQDESTELASSANDGREGFDGSSNEDQRFLKMGDLVEIEYNKSERESVVAVFVQSLKMNGSQGQFFTMQGRWTHLPEKHVQYSIPNWVSPELVSPLLQYLPDAEDMKDEKGLMERAYMEDLSVPRDISAPLVKRMLDFYHESQEIYRRHAAALDGAHQILAHETDLRYGSLISAATTLLRTPADKLPVTALFTVRKALTNGGFAFNIDRRSHRVTGYLQIRSKEQVKMVENVRAWIRQWQEDLAMTVGMTKRQRDRHQTSKGARIMYAFLQKAKAIVAKNRENRLPTTCYNVGISKTRLPVTPEADCVKIHTEDRFSHDEQEIVKFIESWTCSSMFGDLPRIESLPPLILQALGLYDTFNKEQGFVFLQELGTVLPYENRVRFDQYLLLPSSQHSKPLQKLMESLLTMKDKHNLVDSLADMRHDWKDLPVFCIDDASAQEIDDGISVESAGTDHDGRPVHWLHIHVANPTAFFSRDHPLAKMARHMGETIYMPERTYMMLPRWTTRQHFSLEPNRPCMTFSAKLDENGNTLENKITPGIIRNVVSLTPAEVNELLGHHQAKVEELTLTVGGTPPPSKPRADTAKVNARTHHVGPLKTLHALASKRAAIRVREGGISFENDRPQVSVWQSYQRTGLAWDHPFRKGLRTVKGDPIIQLRARGMTNSFSLDLQKSGASRMVQECMLLAGDIAATWCAARQVPIVYRSTLHDPRKPDPKQFWEEQVKPHLRPDGTPPLHIAWEYVQTIGALNLRTTPSKHAFLGLQQYAKVTSPLRRYGDMIHHWQIEAALRREAETGRSLVTAEDRRIDRSFLPFSATVLDTINMGLQPRESMISRAKMAAEKFWMVMLMFRKAVFNEDGHLPFLPYSHYTPELAKPLSVVGPPKASDGTAANDTQPLQFYISVSQDSIDLGGFVHGNIMAINLGASMMRPESLGLEAPRRGDVWECFIQHINVYMRAIILQPVRLVGRDGAGLL